MMNRRNAMALSLLGGALLLAPMAMTQSRTPAAPAPAVTSAPAARPSNLTGVQRFELRPSGISRIGFTSDAPLETVDGLSTATSGSFAVDLANPSRQLSGTVQIPTASLRTGNDMRDEHLRGANWFDAARFPNISLELTGTTLNRPLTAAAPARGNVRARLTLHGVTHDVTVPVTVRLVPLAAEHSEMGAVGINADMLRVQGEFSVRLTDYGVSVPTILRLKVSNEIQLRVNLTAFRQA